MAATGAKRLLGENMRKDNKPGRRAVQSVWPAFYRELIAVSLRLLAYLGGLAALAILAVETIRHPGTLAAIELPARPQWAEIGRPHPAFALALPDLHGGEFRYALHRHTGGSGRKDTMSWGERDRAQSYFMVEIYRPGREIDAFAGPANEIATRVAQLGSIKTVTPSTSLDSKFGRFATAGFSVAHDHGTRHCLGFALPVEEPRLQIAGVYCKPEGEIIDRGLLACALDRLSLNSAGSDTRLAVLFARAELKRTFCGQKSPFLYATPKREGWMAGGSEAKLRGRVSER
jgi:hypothetical protein